MGSEIVYCNSCGDRLLERDFIKGKAATIREKHYCLVCIPEFAEVPKPKEEPRRRTRTTRIPKVEGTPSRRPLMIGIAIAVIAFILVLIVLTRG